MANCSSCIERAREFMHERGFVPGTEMDGVIAEFAESEAASAVADERRRIAEKIRSAEPQKDGDADGWYAQGFLDAKKRFIEQLEAS